MKNNKLFIVFLFILSIILFIFYRKTKFETFSNINNKNYDLQTPGIYPQSVNYPILNDYPFTNLQGISNDNSSYIWKYYPVFSLPSHEQITNNLRYRYNPDEGTCSRAEFCGALYKSISTKHNEIYPLGPAQTGTGARINYYRSQPNNLFFTNSTNENVLY